MTAIVSNTHPLYDRHLKIWRKVKDVLDGEEEVKLKREVYLPMPPAMAAESDPDKKESHYVFYRSFAELPDFTAHAHNNIVGMITRKPCNISVPSRMEYLLTSADGKGTPIQEFFNQIIEQSTAYGRYGILTDAPGDGGEPYLCGYKAFDIINWNEDKQEKELKNGGSGHLDIVVLNESYNAKSEENLFERQYVHRFRVLYVSNMVYRVQVWEGKTLAENDKINDRGIIDSESTNAELVSDTIIETSGQPFDYIPFVIAGSKSNRIEPDPAPMAPIARKALDIYRKKASYGRAIFMTGDPTPVIAGCKDSEKPKTIGSTAAWVFQDPTATAKFLDTEGKGIESQREAIMDDFEEAGKYGATLIQTARNGVESGDALRIRLQNQTADAVTLAISAGNALEAALRSCARFLGLDETEVQVEPNLDFVEQRMFGQDLINYVAAKNQGAPLSQRSLHQLMVQGELTTMTFEQEQAEIANEDPMGIDILQQVMEMETLSREGSQDGKEEETQDPQ